MAATERPVPSAAVASDYHHIFLRKRAAHRSRWSFLDLINSTKRRQKERNKRKNFFDHSFHHLPELCFFFLFWFVSILLECGAPPPPFGVRRRGSTSRNSLQDCCCLLMLPIRNNVELLRLVMVDVMWFHFFESLFVPAPLQDSLSMATWKTLFFLCVAFIFSFFFSFFCFRNFLYHFSSFSFQLLGV